MVEAPKASAPSPAPSFTEVQQMPATTPVVLDHLVLTAANETQAHGYRAQLEARRRSGQLVESIRTHVVTDPGGRRIGSGGSTLLVLYHLARTLPAAPSLAQRFAGKRIVILHAGGDSKRLPAYAAQGKIFTPLPCHTAEGQPATLFDLLLANLLKIPATPGGQVLIAAGDVLLTFEPSEIDWNRPGVTGICYPDSVERAARHGVYVTQSGGEVVDFLQKPGEAELYQRRALEAAGRALIDTGVLSLDPTAVEVFCRAAGLGLEGDAIVWQAGLLRDLESGAATEIDLYEEIALALAREVTPVLYEQRVLTLPRNAHPEQQARLRQLYHHLHGLRFQAQVLSYCDFFHVGSGPELLGGLVGRSRTSATYGFRNLARAVVPPAFPVERAFVYNAVLESDPIQCGPATLLEGVHAHCPLELAGRNLVTNLCAEVTRPVWLPEGIGLLMLPVGPNDWTAVVYGLRDTFSQPYASGRCTFLNAPLDEFLQRKQLAPGMLWPQGNQTLHLAKLWTTGTADEVVQHAQWLLGKEMAPDLVQSWHTQPRLSLADLLRQVNHQRLLAHRANIQRLVDLHRPFDQLAADPDFDAGRLVEQVHHRREAVKILDDLAGGLSRHSDPNLRARVLALAVLLRRRLDVLPADADAQREFEERAEGLAGSSSAEALGQAASAAVAESIARLVALPQRQPVAAIAQDQVVWATAPARLDFAGGWSDTPPVCTDRGGTVVNAAIKLNQQYPIQAIAKLNEDHVVNLTSIDLGRRMVFERIEELLDYTDPSDWSSLPKACLCLAGLPAGQTRGELRPVLRKLGGGVDLTVFSALPKGSGLGTSSILGATVLSCLARLLGETLTHEQLIQRTSLLEQLMTTGGGWQDQVGGILPGVKLIRTSPGPQQTPAVFWSAFPREFAARMLLYYTGFKRLARNILQNVVHRYLARDPVLLRTIDQLKEGADQVRHSIDTRDGEAFGQGVGRYWELKKRVDPGATTPVIEELLARVGSWCSGCTLLGAGGGGFLLLVSRSKDATQRIRVELTARPTAAGARFFEFAIDEQGLSVCVL
jgi:fucokinase